MPGNPHDALFKAVFAEPEHARGALQEVVPPAVVQALDWSTLDTTSTWLILIGDPSPSAPAPTSEAPTFASGH